MTTAHTDDRGHLILVELLNECSYTCDVTDYNLRLFARDHPCRAPGYLLELVRNYWLSSHLLDCKFRMMGITLQARINRPQLRAGVLTQCSEGRTVRCDLNDYNLYQITNLALRARLQNADDLMRFVRTSLERVFTLEGDFYIETSLGDLQLYGHHE